MIERVNVKLSGKIRATVFIVSYCFGFDIVWIELLLYTMTSLSCDKALIIRGSVNKYGMMII